MNTIVATKIKPLFAIHSREARMLRDSLDRDVGISILDFVRYKIQWVLLDRINPIRSHTFSIDYHTKKLDNPTQIIYYINSSRKGEQNK